uniref:NADH:ubiquinone reductase (H(+)-translocating) n=1 Tax=Euretidae gen. sp. DVL-2014 TaxID=1569957 RepID=A0A0N7AFR1_9METZ|nr:NADH dehydrogenase subunit 2 [Euretidae gen. sp. DVL-2014]
MTWPEILTTIILTKTISSSKNKIIEFISTTIILYSILLLATQSHTLTTHIWNNNIQLWIICAGTILITITKTETLIQKILISLILTSITITLIKNWITLYITIELQTIITILIISLNTQNSQSKEAGIKYFILSAYSSTLFLISILIIYKNIYNIQTTHQIITNTIFPTTFIILIILFKLGSSPFHTWLPDIFESTKSQYLTFLILIPKIAILSILITTNPHTNLILISGLLSTIIGAIGAINQKIKRLLAYSSINNTGIILLSIHPHTLQSIQAALTHIITYTISTTTILTILHTKTLKKGLITEIFENDKNQNKTNTSISLLLLSLSGIPPLPGFLSKWLIITSIISNNIILTPIWILITNIPAAIYYLYITAHNFFKKKINTLPILKEKVSVNYKIATLLFPSITITIHPHTLLITTWTTSISILNMPTNNINPTN